MRLENATSALPKNKVIASSLGAALATLAIAGLKSRGIELDEQVQAAIAVLFTFGLGYMVPDRR
jgi:hypothetical protein